MYNKTHGRESKTKQIIVYYGDKELEKDEQISTYNIYNYSTITADINHNTKKTM